MYKGWWICTWFSKYQRNGRIFTPCTYTFLSFLARAVAHSNHIGDTSVQISGTIKTICNLITLFAEYNTLFDKTNCCFLNVSNFLYNQLNYESSHNQRLCFCLLSGLFGFPPLADNFFLARVVHRWRGCSYKRTTSGDIFLRLVFIGWLIHRS